MDPQYGFEPMSYWITFKPKKGPIYSGSLSLAKLDIEPKELLLQDVAILNNERDIIKEYPEDELLWVKVDDNITILEIKRVKIEPEPNLTQITVKILKELFWPGKIVLKK